MPLDPGQGCPGADRWVSDNSLYLMPPPLRPSLLLGSERYHEVDASLVEGRRRLEDSSSGCAVDDQVDSEPAVVGSVSAMAVWEMFDCKRHGALVVADSVESS